MREIMNPQDDEQSEDGERQGEIDYRVRVPGRGPNKSKGSGDGDGRKDVAWAAADNAWAFPRSPVHGSVIATGTPF